MQSNVRARVCEWTYIYGVNHYTEIASVGRCQVQTAQYHTPRGRTMVIARYCPL